MMRTRRPARKRELYPAARAESGRFGDASSICDELTLLSRENFTLAAPQGTPASRER